MPSIDDVAGNSSALLTNAGLAAFSLLLLLFSATLFNQTLQEHRPEVEAKMARLMGPLRGFARALHRGGLAWQSASWVGVLLVTGGLYSLLDPDLAWDAPSGVLFLSVILGVGLLTFLYSGLEAHMTERLFAVPAAVRVYAPCLVIVGASVALSRAIDFQPGLVYGFVASCVVLRETHVGEHEQGRVNVVPVTAALVVSVGAWLLVSPIRSANADGGNWLLALLEAVAVMTFVGGVEGLFFNMVPLSVMDGGKIYRWKRGVWAVLALICAFLFWHVLLNRERSAYGGLTETNSVVALAFCLGFAALSVGTWAYFRYRPSPALA